MSAEIKFRGEMLEPAYGSKAEWITHQTPPESLTQLLQRTDKGF